MAFDEGLAQRLREILADDESIEEKKMFGGLSFMHQGNLCCGVIKDELIVRVGPEQDTEALERPFARRFDFTGREMKGWVTVSPEGIESDEDLTAWVEMGLTFVATLPAK